MTRDFVARTQRLATQFIADSNELNALGAEFALGTDTQVNELASGDAIDLSQHPILATQLSAFYATLAGLLAPLTDEQKSAIYALKS